MDIREIIKDAFRSFTSNKLRTFLSMLGIIIGVTAVIVVLSLGEGTRASITNMVSSLGSNILTISPGSTGGRGGQASQQLSNLLTENDVELIKESCPSIDLVTPVLQRNMSVQYGSLNESASVNGAYPEIMTIANLEIQDGRFFNEEDVAENKNVIVLGSDIAYALANTGYIVDERLYLATNIDKEVYKIPFRVIGVTKKTGGMGPLNYDRMVLIPYSTAKAKIFGNQSSLSSIMASAESEEVATNALYEVDQILYQKFDDENMYRILSQETILDTINQMNDLMNIFLVAIASISLLVGGIGIMNIMLVSVTERTREIGIKLAIGASRMRVLMEFLVESLLITVLAGLFGIGLGVGMSELAEIFGKATQFQTKITWGSVSLAFIISSSIGLFFGIYPADKASKLNPVEALRYE